MSCQCDPFDRHGGFRPKVTVWDGCFVVWMDGWLQALRREGGKEGLCWHMWDH